MDRVALIVVRQLQQKFGLDTDTVKDLEQDAEVFLYEHQYQIQTANSPQSYKFRILHNHVLNRIKKYLNGMNVLSYADYSPVQDKEQSDLSYLLQSLNPQQQDLIRARFFLGEPLEAIAHRQGVSTRTIIRKLKSILNHLKSQLSR